ncbi:MAG: hypothetical protein WBX06_12775, partial [Acidobacteriaceae bacterium]
PLRSAPADVDEGGSRDGDRRHLFIRQDANFGVCDGYYLTGMTGLALLDERKGGVLGQPFDE